MKKICCRLPRLGELAETINKGDIEVKIIKVYESPNDSKEVIARIKITLVDKHTIETLGNKFLVCPKQSTEGVTIFRQKI